MLMLILIILAGLVFIVRSITSARSFIGVIVQEQVTYAIQTYDYRLYKISNWSNITDVDTDEKFDWKKCMGKPVRILGKVCPNPRFIDLFEIDTL